MIESALQWFKDNLSATEIRINGITYVASGNGHVHRIERDAGEITYAAKDRNGNFLHIGTVQGLVDLYKTYFNDKPMRVTIDLHNKEVVGLISPQMSWPWDVYPKQREAIIVVLARDEAQDKRFQYTELLDWLDLHADHFTRNCPYDEIRRAVKVLKKIDTSTVEMEDRGGYIQIIQQQTKGLESGGEKIPTEIEVDLPVGTLEYEIPHKFRLRFDDPGFSLKILNRSEIEKQLLESITLDPKAGLPADRVCIVQ